MMKPIESQAMTKARAATKLLNKAKDGALSVQSEGDFRRWHHSLIEARRYHAECIEQCTTDERRQLFDEDAKRILGENHPLLPIVKRFAGSIK